MRICWSLTISIVSHCHHHLSHLITIRNPPLNGTPDRPCPPVDPPQPLRLPLPRRHLAQLPGHTMGPNPVTPSSSELCPSQSQAPRGTPEQQPPPPPGCSWTARDDSHVLAIQLITLAKAMSYSLTAYGCLLARTVYLMFRNSTPQSSAASSRYADHKGAFAPSSPLS